MLNFLPIGHGFKLSGAPHNILGDCRHCNDVKLKDLNHLLCCPQSRFDNFESIFIEAFEKAWIIDDQAATYVAPLLLSRVPTIRDFDRVLNDKLARIASSLPPNVPKTG